MLQKEACELAWEALTDIYDLNKNCLYVTYFAGSDELGLKADEETKHIWLDIGFVNVIILYLKDKAVNFVKNSCIPKTVQYTCMP